MVNEIIRNLTMDYLLQSPAGEKLQKAMEMVSFAQENLYAFAFNSKEDGFDLMKLRIGTVLTLATFGKIVAGKRVEEFTQEDWIQIAQAVSQYAIRIDGQRYSEFVFMLYADYIDTSAYCVSGRVSEKTEMVIHDLAEELRVKTRLLEDAEIREVDYVEECLWISLEAMVKLLSSMTEQIFGDENWEYAHLAEASAMFAFEFARYKLYQREQEILTEYIEHQYQVDDELEAKFEAYLQEMNADSEYFGGLIADAFDSDFRISLRASGELARAVGVKEEDILDSIEKIDAFFM